MTLFSFDLPLLAALPFPEIDPVFLKLGPLQFRWYGLMYLLGLASAYYVIRSRAAAKMVNLSNEQLYDLIVYAALGVFIGGRIGYTLFYNASYYLQHPLSILAVWEGGMSFHGGLIGTSLAILLFCRRKGFAVYTIADLAAQAVPIGLGFGRIGNFINGELFGRHTDVDWCMVFPRGGDVCRHPSQLYEAGLEGLALFLLLWGLSRLSTPPGTLFWSFIGGYGLFRAFVELFREPDTHLGYLLGPLTMGQLLSLPMFLLGIVMIAIGYRSSPSRT